MGESQGAIPETVNCNFPVYSCFFTATDRLVSLCPFLVAKSELTCPHVLVCCVGLFDCFFVFFTFGCSFKRLKERNVIQSWLAGVGSQATVSKLELQPRQSSGQKSGRKIMRLDVKNMLEPEWDFRNLSRQRQVTYRRGISDKNIWKYENRLEQDIRIGKTPKIFSLGDFLGTSILILEAQQFSWRCVVSPLLQYESLHFSVGEAVYHLLNFSKGEDKR